MRLKQAIICGLAGLMLSACGEDKSTSLQDSLTTANTVDTISDLDFGAGVIPFPNNLLFLDPLTGEPPADGTLSIPVDDPTDLSDPAVAMNALDGFSTVAPISTGFSGALDESSFPAGVRLYEVTTVSGVVASVDGRLEYGTEFIATLSSVDSTNSTLVILPRQPLQPKQAYMAVITNGVKSVSGRPVGISASYALTHQLDTLFENGVSTTPLLTDAQAAQLEQIRLATVAAEAALNTFDGTGSSEIIISWIFTTQSTTEVLDATRDQNRALTAVAGFSPAVATSSPLGAADIHAGVLDVPYYLTASSTAISPSNDPTALASCWNGGVIGSCALGPHTTQFNTKPALSSTQTIPLLVSIPKSAGACTAGMPGTGWPVVVYQHGITTNRTTMLAIADAMAGACMAVVAIDLPMHGVTGNETNGTAVFKNPGINGGERTFDLDLVTQDTDGNITVAAPDGVIDSSGRHFINLSNLLNTRDNVRQAVSDLFVLVDAIEEGAVTDGTNTMDPAKIYFLGHSLGAMVGTTFLAHEDGVRDATLANGGVSLPKILDGSAAFGPSIAAGLAANGIIKGTPDYEAFLGAAQTVVDSGDPVNHASAAVEDRGILFFEIVGGPSSPSDLVVPNTVPDGNDGSGTVPAPLAGTEPQLQLMGLTHVNTTQGPGADDLKLTTKFIAGAHSSLLDPGPDAAVTAELQTQAASFLASDGRLLQVTDGSVLLAPTP